MNQRAQMERGRGPAAVEIGDRWALSFGTSSMEIDPSRGARICSFSLKGKNVLTGPEVDPDNYGSTFWTSPQSDWNWPPVEEIDSRAYAVVESDSGLVCASGLSSRLGVIITKRFSVIPATNAFRVEYEISNQSSDTLRMAPWEVSRTAGGLSFFRSGEDMEQPESHAPLEVEQLGGVTWFNYDRGRIDTDQKLFAHSGDGWLCHIDSGLALLKVFEPVPTQKQAPGEAMVEIFASGSKDYIELEQQGAYSKIGPWKSLTWRVHWLLREVPDGIRVGIGSQELVQWVESLR